MGIIERIQQWAKAQRDIRVALLTSSRANQKKSIDQFSDYDIELYADDIASYTEDNKWVANFGNILITLSEKRVLLGIGQPTRLVIYEDGTKVDFTIVSMNVLRQISILPFLPEWLDDGYEVLLDKDGVTKTLRKPAYRAYIPKKPDIEEFKKLVNEFWWEITYFAKNLARNELFPAKYSGDYVIRYKVLLKMLEWYVQINRGWNCQTGLVGKGIMDLLSKDDQDALRRLFTGADIQDNWHVLLNTIAFFRKISLAVAHDLGYEYPRGLDKRVSQYIEKIKRSGG
jgi:aminoglycoside 6-adenylyltransferase